MNKIIINSHSNTLFGIEMFRGVAAIMVVVYHISRHYEKTYGEFPFSYVTEFGHAGVDFFFTLSGFIILYIHHKDINNKSMLYSYFVKRFARVYPFYWFMLVISLAMIPFISIAIFPGFVDVLKEIVLWPKGGDLIIGVSWTLQHEVLFYLLFSFLIFNKYLGALIMTLWFGVLIVDNYICPLPLKIPIILSAFNLQFLMGMFSAFGIVFFKRNISILSILP